MLRLATSECWRNVGFCDFDCYTSILCLLLVCGVCDRQWLGELLVSIAWRQGYVCPEEVGGGNRERVQGTVPGEEVSAHSPGGKPGQTSSASQGLI